MARNAIRTSAAAMVVAALFGPAATAVAQDQMKMGLLECVGVAGGSPKSLNCRFTDAIGIDSEGGYAGSRVDFYRGSIDRGGPEIGSTQQQPVAAWEVFAPEGARYSLGALGGGFTRVSAEATLGLGPNAMVGGLSGAFALQPYSAESPTGADIAPGITALVLVAR